MTMKERLGASLVRMTIVAFNYRKYIIYSAKFKKIFTGKCFLVCPPSGNMARKQCFLVCPPSGNMARKQCFLVCPPLGNMARKQCFFS